MPENNFVLVTLTIGHLNYFCDLSNYAILSFLILTCSSQIVLSMIYYTPALFILHTTYMHRIVKFT